MIEICKIYFCLNFFLFSSIASANEKIINYFIKHDVIFTAVFSCENDNRYFMINRIAKGSVDAKLMVLANLQASKKFLKPGDQVIFRHIRNEKIIGFSPIDKNGVFSINLDGKLEECNIHTALRAVSEVPVEMFLNDFKKNLWNSDF